MPRTLFPKESIVWSDLLFGLTMLMTVFVFDQHMRTRMPLIVRGAVTLLLIGAIGWFIAHDLGIHVSSSSVFTNKETNS